jgi:hypothetical protein
LPCGDHFLKSVLEKFTRLPEGPVGLAVVEELGRLPSAAFVVAAMHVVLMSTVGIVVDAYRCGLTRSVQVSEHDRVARNG